MEIPKVLLSLDIETAKRASVWLSLISLFGNKTSLPDRTICKMLGINKNQWYRLKASLIDEGCLLQDPAGELLIAPLPSYGIGSRLQAAQSIIITSLRYRYRCGWKTGDVD